eukprot:COSAG02_NODE_612_length_19541_cov_13.245150_4_plen_84_part_00
MDGSPQMEEGCVTIEATAAGKALFRASTIDSVRYSHQTTSNNDHVISTYIYILPRYGTVMADASPVVLDCRWAPPVEHRAFQC